MPGARAEGLHRGASFTKYSLFMLGSCIRVLGGSLCVSVIALAVSYNINFVRQIELTSLR